MVSNFIHFFGPTNLCEPEVFRFSLVLLNYLFSTAEEAKLSISVQSGNLWNKFFFFFGGGRVDEGAGGGYIICHGFVFGLMSCRFLIDQQLKLCDKTDTTVGWLG